MSTKEKEVKTLDKLKQFFRFNKSAIGNIKREEDFSLSVDLEKELSSESPITIRIKVIAELLQTVLNNKLEENAPAKLWCLLEDLFSPEVPQDIRHLVFAFFRALIQGQYERIGMMRLQFFRLVANHSVPGDIVPRLEIFQTLTDSGKDILYMEENVGRFLLEWMPDIISVGKELDFLCILITCIKYNASYFDEYVISGIVQNTCLLCCRSKEEQVVVKCLEVLDTIVCYTSLPSESLLTFIPTLCKTVNIELYCQNSWKIMRNLLGTHLGHSSLKTMCDILKSDKSLSDPGLLRGAIFYINMALWGNKVIINLICTPAAVLDAYLAAVRCNHNIVMYEIILGIQRLVNKQGKYLLDPIWTIALEIIKQISIHIDGRGPSSWGNQVGVHLHETLDDIEQLIENSSFNGRARMVFDIIERCSNTRSETSVEKLIAYIAKSINPSHSRWLEKLDNLMLRFFDQDERPVIRRKVLKILASCIQSYRHIYECELTRIALNHLNDISKEPNLSIRIVATQILVELFINSEPLRSLEVLEILEKVLGRPYTKDEKILSEEDAEDIKTAAHGLVNGFTKAMYQSNPAPALKAFEMIVRHLDSHYTCPSLLAHVTTVRYIMLECLLKVRSNTDYRIGFVGQKRYSMSLFVGNPKLKDPSKQGNISNCIDISQAICMILTALRFETDWKVMLLLLQEFPKMLKSSPLFIQEDGSFDFDVIASTVTALVSETALNLPERLTNTPPKFTKSDFHSYVFPVVTSLIPYHTRLESALQQKIIKTLESGLAIRSARQCVFALTLCVLEMQDTMVKLLPEVLLNLSKISATIHIAIPILEFLSTLTQIPKVFVNFVGDQYMAVFAISLPYTNPFKYNHYTVSLAHHVIAAWFLKCRLPFRKDFVKFILNGLKTNIILCFEDLHLGARSGELVNEDSSNRKRSSSLTEQGSRKRDTRPSVSRFDLKPQMDESLVNFHKELTETCMDLMAMYTFSTCSPVPQRNSAAEKVFNGGQSMTWLVGNKLVTVTTSGCTLKALKHGFCDRCYHECRIRPSRLTRRDETKGTGKMSGNMESNYPSTSVPTTPEKEKPPSTFEHNRSPSNLGFGKPERQICACWCKAWAEILIKRATGSISWTMRLSNELHPLQCPKDFASSDICAYSLPLLSSASFEDQVPLRSNRVASEPVSIPCSPIRKNAYEFGEDSSVFGEEGSGRSRNPVRRSNSSPEMSSNWKNPLLGPEPTEFDYLENKKKQTYSKDIRSNWEAIPEEMGTTPPTSEALLLATCDNPDSKSPPSTSKDYDPSGLPPLGFKRDRGHTISVMSPARKPERSASYDPRPRSPKPREAIPTRSGVNPAFAFLQLYHSPYFGFAHEKPLLISNVPSVQSTLKNLDWIPPYEVHKIGVLYVGPGQENSEADILRNEYGSVRYIRFLERLGTLINLPQADRQQVFLGGLETNGNDGKYAYIWQDDVMQVIFHVATLMPNSPNDPKGNRKKAHIGNNYVTIVYNDSGEEYNFQTVRAQFNYAVVVVEPLDLATNQVIVKAREELHPHICHTEYKVVSDESVAILARQLAVHSNLASVISCQLNTVTMEPYASNWLERLRHIKRIRTKLQQEQNTGEENKQPKFSSRRLLIDDFTEYS
uniref:Tuberin n=1 Tax=Pyrrhocoris apterus TaxID=37000 RepID=A0AAU7B8N1_PYRAP